MRKNQNRSTRYWLKVSLLVVLLVGVTIQADCADLGQGNHITRETAAIIHGVAEWETMTARLEYQLDRLEAESTKCNLVRQDEGNSVCEAKLRDLYEKVQALYRNFNTTAAELESEIAKVKQKADPQHLEILARMQKKVSQKRSQINQWLRSVSGSG